MKQIDGLILQKLGLVFLGGVLGGLLRLGLNALVPGSGILIANLAGSFILALFTQWALSKGEAVARLHAFVAPGLLGGFTTFSALYGTELATIQQGQTLAATLYLFASLAGGYACAALGWMIGQTVFAGGDRHE